MQRTICSSLSLLILISLFLYPALGQAAELREAAPEPACLVGQAINGQKSDVCQFLVVFKGTIEVGDELKIERFFSVKRAQHPPESRLEFTFFLDSDGGNVETALSIGRAFRSANTYVNVPAGALCASACVLILAGGVERIIHGRVLIHRPYFTKLDPALSAQQVDSRYKAIKKEVSDYFDEMNVPRTLAELMMTIRPEDAQSLTEEELHQYMLNQEDPAYDEKTVSEVAANYKLDSDEYRKRFLMALRNCVPTAWRCWDSIFWGIPLKFLAQREQTWDRLSRDPSIFSLTPEEIRACRVAVYQRGASACH